MQCALCGLRFLQLAFERVIFEANPKPFSVHLTSKGPQSQVHANAQEQAHAQVPQSTCSAKGVLHDGTGAVK